MSKKNKQPEPPVAVVWPALEKVVAAAPTMTAPMLGPPAPPLPGVPLAYVNLERTVAGPLHALTELTRQVCDDLTLDERSLIHVRIGQWHAALHISGARWVEFLHDATERA